MSNITFCGYTQEEIKGMAAEIERLTDENRKMNNTLAKDAVEIFEQGQEIERLTAALRSEGANRYWEGRWREAEAEIERLTAENARLTEWIEAVGGLRRPLGDGTIGERKSDERT